MVTHLSSHHKRQNKILVENQTSCEFYHVFQNAQKQCLNNTPYFPPSTFELFRLLTQTLRRMAQCESALLSLFVRVARQELAAGFTERAVALFQAQIEYNACRPQGVSGTYRCIGVGQ